MTLSQLSRQYGESAALLAARVAELRACSRSLTDPDERRALRRRIGDLQPMLYQCRELQRLTAHYYDRSCHGPYTV